MRWPTQKPFNPPYDVVEQQYQVVILVEVAGMQAEDFNITFTRDLLIISGKRQRPDFGPCAFHRVEVGFGEFRIEIPIPWTVRANEVSAKYHEGFLQIALPRTEKRQIEVVDTSQMQIGTANQDDNADE